MIDLNARMALLATGRIWIIAGNSNILPGQHRDQVMPISPYIYLSHARFVLIVIEIRGEVVVENQATKVMLKINFCCFLIELKL